jgi:hypothetical protein
MTMSSRGISSIQRKARGKDKMAKKSGMPMLPKKESAKVSVKKRAPMMDSMGAGAPMGRAVPPMGMKKGGSCAPKMAKGGSCKGYYKGGSVDGVISKGRTKGKIC